MAVQTLLIVRYAWTEKQMKTAEYFFFATGLGVPIITVIWATAKGLFFPMEIGKTLVYNMSLPQTKKLITPWRSKASAG